MPNCIGCRNELITEILELVQNLLLNEVYEDLDDVELNYEEFRDGLKDLLFRK